MLEGSRVIATPVVYNSLVGQTIGIGNGAEQVAARLQNIGATAASAVTQRVSSETLFLATVYLKEVSQLDGGFVVDVENGDYYWVNKSTGPKRYIPSAIEGIAERELTRREAYR